MKKFILTSATLLFISLASFAHDGKKCDKKCEKKCDKKECTKDEKCSHNGGSGECKPDMKCKHDASKSKGKCCDMDGVKKELPAENKEVK